LRELAPGTSNAAIGPEPGIRRYQLHFRITDGQSHATGQGMLYGRELLLHGEKRNAVLDLPEIHRYGIDSYGDADYVCIYGLQPAQWYARGIRLLGRTAVECTRDALGSAIGRDVAAIASDTTHAIVVDPFAGSGNTLYWLLCNLPGAQGLGFELDSGVFHLTRKNLSLLALPIDVFNVDYMAGFSQVRAAPGSLLVVFIAPPWGHALDPVHGLDLRRTEPPRDSNCRSSAGKLCSMPPALCGPGLRNHRAGVVD
jgi:hypothetical protein